ncbi:hepatic leukemia factor-like [Plakobranchus ocellatus]|uniref:Hepatic leukemia factor-like n=1 Tax=Plakobranchus ocellatus TaxID=259542 RepID=A0AAV4AS38_9GAST|nr:hepatic leukemia factor-like [Plakobranchus ocellatus]
MAYPPPFLGSVTLKALLEDPNLKNPPLIGQSSSSLKVKKEDDTGFPQYNYGSAFLGPNLWDRTLDSTDFNLEYMDLDEFLSENGIPLAGEDATNLSPNGPQTNGMPGSPRHFLKTPPLLNNSQYKAMSPHYSASAASPPAGAAQIQAPQKQSGNKSPSPPVSPFNVDFQVSEQDLALASIPDYGEGSSGYRPKWQAWTQINGLKNGHVDFDPRKRNFTDEELKPQPIIKKSKKIFVPDGMKDDKYWARRHKNNFAAKRSRDARRVRENQIAMRAAFLEKENSCLRDEMSKLRKENAQLKAKVDKYEGTGASVEGIVGLPL